MRGQNFFCTSRIKPIKIYLDASMSVARCNGWDSLLHVLCQQSYFYPTSNRLTGDNASTMGEQKETQSM